jgi:hypothetical protein
MPRSSSKQRSESGSDDDWGDWRGSSTAASAILATSSGVSTDATNTDTVLSQQQTTPPPKKFDAVMRARAPWRRVPWANMVEGCGQGCGQGLLGCGQGLLGGGFKGAGKGSLGDPVPPLSADTSEGSGSGADQTAIAPNVFGCPKPEYQTEEEIKFLLAGGYYKPLPSMWRGSSTDLKAGMSILWKGVKKDHPNLWPSFLGT